MQRNTAEPLGTFQVGFGVDLADTYSGAQGERLFSRAPDSTKIFQPRVQTVYTAILLESSGKGILICGDILIADPIYILTKVAEK